MMQPHARHTDTDVLFVNFNQDATSLAVGTKKGYALYGLSSIDELQKIHESTEVEETCLVERLFSSSLVTVVSLTAPRKLRVCHFQRGTEICSHSYANTILSVRLNRLRVVVCLEESVYVHNIRDMKVLHTIRDTPPNTHGLCDLTAVDASYLAYPGSATTGEVHVFDAADLQAVTTIAAHASPLAALKFNGDGTKLATASEKGTVIRVFDVHKGERLFEFRRGVKRCVTINSLAFSSDSLYLCSSSNTETLHIFKLDPSQRGKHPPDHRNLSDDEGPPYAGSPSAHHQHQQQQQQQPQQGMAGWMNYMSDAVSTYLPTQVTEIFQQDRSFATARLPAVGARNVVAMATLKQKPRLFVASTDGYLYIYNVEPEGGECALVKQHRFSTAGQPTATSDDLLAAPSSGAGDQQTRNKQQQQQQQQQQRPPGKGAVPSTTAATATAGSIPVQYSSAVASSAVSVQGDSSRTQSEQEQLAHATAGAGPANLAGLRLEDSAEFPPMTHSADD